MDVEAIRTFVGVARRGGFSPVARDLGVEPSSVSRTVAALERELGVRLFQRSTRRLALTEAGATYLEQVQPGLDVLDAARDAAAGGAAPAGTLRLAASVAFGDACLVPLLPELRRRFPALKLDLVLDDRNVDLIAERIDLAIRLAPGIDLDVIGVKLLATRYRVCASPAYLARAGTPARPADLTEHRCLRFPLPGYRDAWRFRDGSGAAVEVRVDGDIIASSALVLKSSAIAGLGPVLLPDWLIRSDLASGALVDCFPSHDVAATSFETGAWLLYPSRTFLPAKVRVTIDYLTKCLAGEHSA